jgi:hypothetical protein
MAIIVNKKMSNFLIDIICNQVIMIKTDRIMKEINKIVIERE